MVQLPQQFNVADLPDSGGVVHIPEGQYQAVIVNSELQSTKNGDGQYLALTVVITAGQYKDTELIERLNIINPNQQAVEIAYKTLARISEAVGMTQTPADSSELHNKPLMVDVKTEKGKPWTDQNGQQREGADRSVIKKYLPMPQGSSQGQATAPPFAQQQAQQPQQSAPAAQTPPWAAQ